jgi:hypothetical protein
MSGSSGGGEDSPWVDLNFQAGPYEAGGNRCGLAFCTSASIPHDHVRIGMPGDLRVDKQKAV